MLTLSDTKQSVHEWECEIEKLNCCSHLPVDWQVELPVIFELFFYFFVCQECAVELA